MSQPPVGASAAIEKFSVAIYLVAVLCMLGPPLDVIFSMPAIDMKNVSWRFGAVGLLTGAALLPLVGLTLALVTAVLCDHRWMQRILLVLGGIAAIGLLLALGLFVLDALQVRRTINPQIVRRYDFTVLKAVLTQLFQLVTLTALLWTARRARRVVKKTAADAGPGLVMAGTRAATQT